MAEHDSAGLTGSWIELGTKLESLLQVLYENAHFGGQPAASRSDRKDWDWSFKGSQKTDDGTFSEFCGQEPCWRLGNTQMFQDTHPHLYIEGLTTKEAARVLGVPEGTVKARLARARVKLAGIMKVTPARQRPRRSLPGWRPLL